MLNATQELRKNMLKIPKNPFVLVDGSSYLFRAYHALPPLITTKGQPTGAIFGVLNMLRKLIKDYQPEHMVVVFDSKEKNFRHALFTDYKANRVKMPDELQSQIGLLCEIIEAMGIPLVIIPGIEADDIIGTLAKKATDNKRFSLISTGDKDFAQLVDENTFLINTMSQDVYDRARVLEKFGVSPERIIDYLALIGDSVDNIPGIPNVGPKTALKWLETYGDLATIVQEADSISGRVGENLRQTLEKLPLFRSLVTIDVNLELNYRLEDFKVKEADNSKLSSLFKELEFKTWTKELTEKKSAEDQKQVEDQQIVVPSKALSPCIDAKLILREADLDLWINSLRDAEVFAFKLKTYELNSTTHLAGISMAFQKTAAYIPFDFPPDLSLEIKAERLSTAFVLKKVAECLNQENAIIVGHDLKFEMRVLANYNIVLGGKLFDTMLGSYVLDSAGSKHHLSAVCFKHLNITSTSIEEIAGKGAKQLSFNQVNIEKASAFACEEAESILKLYHKLSVALAQEPSLLSVFEKIEMPLLPVLSRMEQGGVLINPELLHSQSLYLGKRLQELEQQAFNLAGQTFNLNSPKQLQEILFSKLQIPVIEKTPTGQPSTSESVLQTLAENYPLPKIILDYRSLSKLKSTYTDKLPEELDPETKRIHTCYHQAITSTGRLSSSEPNLQNIPIRSEEGRKIRAAFTAPPGFKIVAFDYSQSELRIMAHLSEDSGLVNAFNLDSDIHRSTASEIFDTPLDKVNSEQRRKAKAINFGLMYGMSSFGLARQLGIDQKEASQYMERYFSVFPGVKLFMDKIREQALSLGYVETLLGRRLYLPELQSRNFAARRAAERAAVNAPMQGTNADIIKLAMIEIDRWIIQNGYSYQVKMIMQVHDELVFEISTTFLKEASDKIKSIMETVVELNVKLCVDVNVGNNWDEAHG